jgi:DNA-binding winged helix-turn-helix (wHTH) protein/predicted esterase
MLRGGLPRDFRESSRSHQIPLRIRRLAWSGELPGGDRRASLGRMAFRFGDFVLDPRTGSLTGPEGPVALRRQAFRLAEVLLEHAPELLDRDTLLDAVWGHDALSPNVLPQTISELRHALGDDAHAPRYIETLHRRGYRMVCAVERIDPGTPSAAAGTTPGISEPTAQRPRWRLPAVVGIVIAALLSSAHWWQRDAHWRWLHVETIPEIRRLIETDLVAAWRLAHAARQRAPDDPVLEQLWLDVSLPVTLTSEPEGATVAVRGYRDEADWLALGRTPLHDVRLPLTMLRFRVDLADHAPIEVAPSVLPAPDAFRLHAADEAPEDMVFVPAGPVRYLLVPAELPDFWIDRHEVSNRDYLRFVEDGGYRRPEFWRHPAIEDGRELAWEELIARLVDSTGLPGPATWALGTFPEGEGDHPVAGVSWYEAAAYAEWAGKSLPTVFHWWRAAGLGIAQVANFSDILAASNFAGRGTVPRGSLGGLGPYGTYDMAGNVAEWCANPAGERRHILGGGWADNAYQFRDFDAQPALERRPGFGFRLVKQATPVDEGLLAEVLFPTRELAPPVDDITFGHFARMFDYDPAPLDAVVEEIDDSHHAWRRERVSFSAGYPGERVILQLLLPRRSQPPYQTVVHFPGGDALMLADSREAGLLQVEPFLRSGRAVAYPVYRGTFERRVQMPPGPLAARSLLVQQVKDLRRTLDYLASRDDIDNDRLAFHGLSYGGWRAPFVLAVEDRFRMAMIMSAGLSAAPLPPEVALHNYLPRVTLPVLLISGRDDFNFPYEQSQRPFFELLGTPDAYKRHVALPWGHLPPGYTEVVRELLDWTDRWLGPVSAVALAARDGGEASE